MPMRCTHINGMNSHESQFIRKVVRKSFEKFPDSIAYKLNHLNYTVLLIFIGFGIEVIAIREIIY